MLITFVQAIISYFLENATANFFTQNASERKYFLLAYRMFIYVTMWALSTTVIMGSILRGSGLQNGALVIPLINYFVIGLPLQYYMVFILDMGLLGSWISYTVSVFLSAFGFLFMIYNINWNK
mmetsp:Transcript_16974/g.2356  ORF Transcript_16974/g.2356 Transcript_16974/m.2356 type:complete len:123 (-) Transcript_16974:171-539(-)